MTKNLISVPPALEDQLRVTWLKRDTAEYAANSFHEDLLNLRGDDDQAFKSDPCVVNVGPQKVQ